MQAIIIEDEKPAARRLGKLIAEVDPEIEILVVLDSVESATDWLNNHPPPDVMFMDIHLADGSSFNLFKKVTVTSPVIFVTAYDEYALDAFKVNSVDYLLKPVKKADLEAAIIKLKNLQLAFSQTSIEHLIHSLGRKYKDRFVIKLGNKIKTVMVDDIAYFYSKDKLSFICDKESKSYPVDLSLDRIETLLDPEVFFRVNRQIITHASAIREIQTGAKSRILLELNPPCQIEAVISSERSALFKKWLKKE